MVEKKLVISDLTLKYTGLFNLQELYYVIDRWSKEMAYDKEEHKHEVQVHSDGVTVNIDTRPYKKISDYIKHIVKCRIQGDKLKDVVVKVDGKETKLQEGTITIILDGYQQTDWEGKWVSNAFSYFLRTIIDKYIYSGYLENYESILKDHVKQLYAEISSYLNMNKYRFDPPKKKA